MVEIKCVDGNGPCYMCPYISKCDFYKYLMGRRSDEGLTYFEKKEKGLI